MKNSNFRNQKAGIQGFTLTELLVVIAIIAVLATLAFLGTNRVRDMANKSNSIRNLSQLQIANTTYASDHNGKFVPLKIIDGGGKAGNRWFQDVKYLATLTGKPAEELEKNPTTAIPLEMLDPKVVRARKPQHDRIYTSYGMNDTSIGGSKPNTEYAYNLNQLSDPSRSMVFATATDLRATYVSRYAWDFKNPKDEKSSGGEIAYRHGNKALVVYFDGHVGEMGKADFEAIDKAGGVSNVFWKAQP
jgi:prepilin-type N-terminal cleavage/methylation domain-containing protein/prepilin-type processing-associated H-X9-DG protein